MPKGLSGYTVNETVLRKIWRLKGLMEKKINLLFVPTEKFSGKHKSIHMNMLLT